MGGHRRIGGNRRAHLAPLLAAALVIGAFAADVQPLTPALPLTDGIVINIPQRWLFLVEEGAVVARYPVGLGRPTWPTFVGPFAIAAKEVDPIWDVPKAIQEELRALGKPAPSRVPPGPNNPLGKYWIGLDVQAFGIHGTTAPRSVGRFESHGCIRMRADDIAELFARVEVGTAGVSIYETVVVNVIDDALWVEAHHDVYGLEADDVEGWVMREAARIAPMLVVATSVVQQVLATRDGRPHRVDTVSAWRNSPHLREYRAVGDGAEAAESPNP